MTLQQRCTLTPAAKLTTSVQPRSATSEVLQSQAVVPGAATGRSFERLDGQARDVERVCPTTREPKQKSNRTSKASSSGDRLGIVESLLDARRSAHTLSTAANYGGNRSVQKPDRPPLSVFQRDPKSNTRLVLNG